jgi:hypothetical protein
MDCSSIANVERKEGVHTFHEGKCIFCKPHQAYEVFFLKKTFILDAEREAFVYSSESSNSMSACQMHKQSKNRGISVGLSAECCVLAGRVACLLRVACLRQEVSSTMLAYNTQTCPTIFEEAPTVLYSYV